jgi:hypothetical protein
MPGRAARIEGGLKKPKDCDCIDVATRGARNALASTQKEVNEAWDKTYSCNS